MRFGIAITNPVNPAVAPAAQADYVRRMALASEESGYDSVWVVERTVFPVDLPKRHPEMFGPHHSKLESQNVLEPVTVLAAVAGMTSRVKLGFTVLILPFRHPVLNAKMVTTLDAMSNGRVIFGVGIGWLREEFEGMSAPYETRAEVSDEHIEMYKALCTKEVANFKGKHFSISGQVFYPKPIQRPYPPIWVGGKTDAAVRRAAKHGDGWDPIWLTTEEFPKKLKLLRELTAANGRPRNAVTTAMTINMHWGEAHRDKNGRRMELTGTTRQLIDDLRAYKDLGLEHIIIMPAANRTGDAVSRVRRLADEVIPKV